MAKVLIDMPDSFIKEHIESYEPGSLVDIAVRNALKHGIVLDGLTNGEVMQKMFPQIEVRDSEVSDLHICVSFNPNEPWEWFDKDWWNRKWGE